MRPEILTGSLAPRHRDAGLSLIETGDDFLILKHDNKEIARYTVFGAKIEEIVKDADKWLNIHSST